MTRDEAIEIVKSKSYQSLQRDFRERLRDDVVDKIVQECAEDDVNGFVALGMLKLDEPKSAEPDAMDLLINQCRSVPYLATFISETVQRAGLMIVKK